MTNSVVRICALLLVLPWQAQCEERSVSGSVVDNRGNALRKAVVQLEDALSQSVRSYVTGDDGRYHFTGLNTKIEYTLRAHYRKVWSKPKTLSVFNASRHLQVDLVIAVE